MFYVCDRVFANKCLNCQPCVQFIFSPRCESDMILSVMTYIYLINSRLDVTHNVRHHFCTATLSVTNGCCIQKIHSARGYAMMGAAMLKRHQFVRSLCSGHCID